MSKIKFIYFFLNIIYYWHIDSSEFWNNSHASDVTLLKYYSEGLCVCVCVRGGGHWDGGHKIGVGG